MATVSEEELLRHSQLLNQLGWRMAQALGRVPQYATDIEGDPVEMLEALIKERDHYLVMVNNWEIAEVDKR